MLPHKGISGCYEKLGSGELFLPYPNHFFQLNTPEQLHAERLHWIIWHNIRDHKESIFAPRPRLGNRIRILDYLALVRDRYAAL